MSPKSFLFKLKMRFWPPLMGAGIRMKNISDDISSFDMEMKLRPWNKNLHGIHFGGSLFAMTDPTFSTIKKEADEKFKSEPKFSAEIRDESETVIATVEKTVYVRRKDKKPTPGYKPPHPQ